MKMKMKSLFRVVAYSSLCISLNSFGAMYQIDRIDMRGSTYPPDLWSLTITGDNTSTVSYTVQASDVNGPNAINAADNWVIDINNHPIMSSVVQADRILASDGYPSIILTGQIANYAFLSSVSVFDSSPNDYSSIRPLEISVYTVQEASPVPLPAGIYLFLSGLAGLGLVRRK